MLSDALWEFIEGVEGYMKRDEGSPGDSVNKSWYDGLLPEIETITVRAEILRMFLDSSKDVDDEAREHLRRVLTSALTVEQIKEAVLAHARPFWEGIGTVSFGPGEAQISRFQAVRFNERTPLKAVK